MQVHVQGSIPNGAIRSERAILGVAEDELLVRLDVALVDLDLAICYHVEGLTDRVDERRVVGDCMIVSERARMPRTCQRVCHRSRRCMQPSMRPSPQPVRVSSLKL